MNIYSAGMLIPLYILIQLIPLLIQLHHNELERYFNLILFFIETFKIFIRKLYHSFFSKLIYNIY